jgi:GNAT superfamily N-acetyltransferase
VNLAALGPPVPIAAEHDTSLFNCRHDSLNQWLRRRALANASSGATRTYVVCAEGRRVVGYYALAAGSLDVASAPTRLRRNMPDPLPVVVLGRLAVDDSWSGRGVGGGLLKTQASSTQRSTVSEPSNQRTTSAAIGWSTAA